MDVVESHPFRVTRDAELAIQELEADDLLETIEQFVRRRRFGSVIRVTIDEAMPSRVRGILNENLELGRRRRVHRALAARAEQPVGRRVHRPAGAQVRAAGAVGAAVARGARGQRALRRHPPPGHPAPPSLRLLRPRGGVPARRGQRPGRARHQADAVPGGPQRAGGRTRSWKRPPTARTSPCWSSSRRASTRRATSAGPRRWSARACTSCTGSSGSRRTARPCRSCAAKATASGATSHLGTGNYNSVTTKQYTDLGYLTADDDIGADATSSSTT